MFIAWIASAHAIVRAFTAGSIRSSNSTITADSPAGTMRYAVDIGRPPGGSERALASAERAQQFLMDAAETAVRHQHDEVPRSMLFRDAGDDVVDRVGFASGLAARVQIADELRHREAFGLRQLRSEVRRDQDLVGGGERAREFVLEHPPARR